MDLFKALTGKNPDEYEHAAKILINKPDVELFKKLVSQDDFLFDFIKNNVEKRIQQACNKDNYINLLQFLDYYSPSYDTVIAEILHQYGTGEIISEIKNLYLSGNNAQKAYAAKFFTFLEPQDINDIVIEIRKNAKSEYEPLSTNSTEVLSKIGDTVLKQEALQKLDSKDEFEQYEGIKFLVNYGAKDTLYKIIDVMKLSSLSENIAAEIPYLISIEDLLQQNFEDGILVLCNIINAIPEILPPPAIYDYNLYEIIENIYNNNLTSSSAILIKMAQEKIKTLTENDEYLFDCDKNTKDEISAFHKFLSSLPSKKINNLIYEELYEDSPFVFFAVDYTNDIEALEAILDSSNQTLVLKVLTILKEKHALSDFHKQTALNFITSPDIRQIVEVL